MQNSLNNIVALARCGTYSSPELRNAAYAVLNAALLPVRPGMRILVKPNLLMAKELACVNPRIVGHVCSWLLDKGAKITVADSPGFGRAASVARFLGLDKILKPLGLQAEALDQPVKVVVPLRLAANGRQIALNISRKALECDLILSVARVKAHKQMRLTLCVKNCFGCVPGLLKALIHARYGESTDFFADCIARLWKELPTVAGVADGITAMHVTGPADGQPFPLGLIGAAMSARYLDAALLSVLKITPDIIPLEMAMRRLDGGTCPEPVFPLEKPEAFNASGFVIPKQLASASFSPARLIKSFAKRIWKSLRA